MKPLQTILLLVACAMPCAAQSGMPSGGPPPPPPPAAEYNPNSWKEFTSAEGRFSVLLPGTPQERVQEGDSPAGRLTAHLFALKTFAQYVVSYVDFPPATDVRDVKAFFDGVRESNVKRLNGKLISEEDDNRLAWPGRAYSLLLADGHVMRVRAFLVRKRLYQVSITMREKDAPAGIARFHDETAAKFLNSFKLIPDSPAAGGSGPGGRPLLGDPQKLPAAAQTEGEVDRLLKSLREKGQYVFGGCPEGEDCPPPPGARVEANKDAVLRGKIISQPAPDYPTLAKAARAQGAVEVRVVVDEEGKVLAAQAVSGHPLLYAAAVAAARRVRLAPPMLDGTAVKMVGIITYNFTLQRP